MQKIFFTAGPAEMYPHFGSYVQDFVDAQLGSISHRSKAFKDLYEFTDRQLRTLLSIPEEHAIMFTGSASEVWEKMIQSTVQFESFHLVNGSFSEKFLSYAQALGKHTVSMQKPVGQGFNFAEIAVPEHAELICTTHNETSTGVQMREPDIHKLKRSNFNKLLVVDMVSSAPYPAFDFETIDAAFFSVQKSFGLPAGLGVWIANEACLNKALSLKNAGENIGAHHDLPTLWKNAKSYQNPSTPNVMGMYLLGRVAEDMNNRGVETLRKETNDKAKRIYQFFENRTGYSVAVDNEEHRSKTVIVINTDVPPTDIIAKCKEENIVLGAGYGAGKDTQIRISNFIANSKEQIDKLLSVFEKI